MRLGYNTYVINLELSVHYYNRIRETVLEVEYPLIEDQLSDIDKKLTHAENSLTWNSPGRRRLSFSPRTGRRRLSLSLLTRTRTRKTALD